MLIQKVIGLRRTPRATFLDYSGISHIGVCYIRYISFVPFLVGEGEFCP